jgi:hypothetical protein
MPALLPMPKKTYSRTTLVKNSSNFSIRSENSFDEDVIITGSYQGKFFSEEFYSKLVDYNAKSMSQW